MERTVKINIENIPEGKTGYEVVTLDGGQLWHYGMYDNWMDACKAASGYEERFIVEVVD